MRYGALCILLLTTACGSSDPVPASGPTDAAGIEASSNVEASSETGAADASSEQPPASTALPCADAGLPPTSLACTGLYTDFAKKEVAANALPYTPATPLWSDGAQKARWIVLPANTQIDISNPNEWVFPIGTKLFKEFRVGSKRVETRMFEKAKANFWVYATYAWNADDSDAPIHFGGPVPIDSDGGTWNIPTNDDCNECHRGRQDRILGFEHVSLGLPGAQGLTLAQLAEMDLVTPKPSRTTLAIGDDRTGLDSLAMGWIHVNCGVTCHNSNPGAAGYGAGMILRLDPTQLDGSPPNAATWNILRTTIGVPCISGSVAGLPRIVPHDATSSVVHQLIDERGTLQMPPIASRLVDTPDVAIVAAWIQAMPAQDGGAPSPDGGVDSGPVDSGMADTGAAVDTGIAVEAQTPETGPTPGDATIADDGGSDATPSPEAAADAPSSSDTDAGD